MMRPTTRRDDDEEGGRATIRRPSRESAATTQKGRPPFGERRSPISWWVVKQEQQEAIVLRKGAYLQFLQNSSYEAAVATNAQRAQERVRSRSSSPRGWHPPSEIVPALPISDALSRLNKAEGADEERFAC